MYIIKIVPSEIEIFQSITCHAEVAELADAHDSKSCSFMECGFDSHLRHQSETVSWWRKPFFYCLMLRDERRLDGPGGISADLGRTSFFTEWVLIRKCFSFPCIWWCWSWLFSRLTFREWGRIGMNWMTRFRNYGFWLSLLAFVAGGLRYAGFDLGITEGNAIVDLIIAILVALGIINDPTTESKWYKDDSKS